MFLPISLYGNPDPVSTARYSTQKKGGTQVYEKYAALRDAKGVTDYAVSVATGIVASTFSDWKAGRSKPKADKLLKIAEYFDVSIEDLI